MALHQNNSGPGNAARFREFLFGNAHRLSLLVQHVYDFGDQAVDVWIWIQPSNMSQTQLDGSVSVDTVSGI